jgi:hypothetical protein
MSFWTQRVWDTQEKEAHMKASADRKHMLIHLTLDADEDELVEGERRERRATTARKTTKEARAGDNE